MKYKKSIKIAGYLSLFLIFLIFLLDFNIRYINSQMKEKLETSTGLETSIEGLSITYDLNSLSINVINIAFFDHKKITVAELNNLNLDINYIDLFNNPTKIHSLAVEELKINSNQVSFNESNEILRNLEKITATLKSFPKISIEEVSFSSKEYQIEGISSRLESEEIIFSIEKFPLSFIYEDIKNTNIDLSGKINFSSINKNNIILPLFLKTADFELNGKINIEKNIFKFSGDINKLDVKKGFLYIQQDSNTANLIEKLNNSIQSGSLHNIKVSYEKELTTKKTLKSSLNAGIFFDEMSFIDGRLNIKNFDGELNFNSSELTINGSAIVSNNQYSIALLALKENQDERLLNIKFADLNSKITGTISYLKNESWDLILDKEGEFSGNFIFPKTDEDIPLVVVENLVIPKKNNKPFKISPSDIPKMTVIAKRIKIENDILPRFEIQLIPSANILTVGYLRLNDFKVNNNPIEFHGAWLEKDKTVLYARITGEKIENLLLALDSDKKIIGGKYDFDIRLYCECAPWQITLNTISGEVVGKIEEGIFTEQDPSLGRLFSLLNIDSISRRLKLNVDDLVNKGFVYDNIKGRGVINNSKLEIDYLNIDSTSNHINVQGSSNLASKTYSLTANVRPEIADSVPAATYLAGGGLAGLGVWLADKALFKGDLLNELVDKFIEFKYFISGPWSKPIIKESKRIL